MARPESVVRPQDLGIGRLFEAVRDAVIVAEASTGRVVLWNPAATEIFGYSASEALDGLNVEALVPERLKERHRSGLSRYHDTGHGPYIDSYRVLDLPAVRKGGEEIRVELSLSPIEPLPEAGGRFVLAVVRDVTERKEAEEALKESEERFRSLVQNSSDVITVAAVDGTILYDSPAVERVLGYKPEERLGTNAFDYIGPDQSEQVTRMLKEILASPGARLTGEMWWPHKDGSLRYLEVSATNLLEDRAVGGIVINWRDITDQKEAEKTLIESEERFRSLIQNASDVILIMGPDQTVRYISPAVERVLGYKPEQVVGHDNFTPVHPDDMPRMEKLMGEVMGSPGTTTPPVELRLRHADCSWRYVETTCTNLLEDPAVGGIVFNTRDITERKSMEERLVRQAFHDSLTGLPNRYLFVDRLAHALERTRRMEGRQAAVLFMDLDGFKVINDSLGHHVGDLLLVLVAERLRRCLRPEDTLARFGGDEFVVLIDEAEGPAEVVRMVERIAHELRRPFGADDRELFVRASIGIALGSARNKDPQDLIREADTAMYEAKESASSYSVFDPAMHERVLGHLELESDLRGALERGELRLFYQPKVRLKDNDEVVEVEALLRWEHPQRGLLMPEEFIPLAEETGLIVPIGRWILREACRQVKEWQERYPTAPPLVACVNVSAGQLRYPDLLHDVASALRESGMEGRSLALEITEGALVKDMQTSMTLLKELREEGIRFALDDFGSEYSSLSYLIQLPVDFVKIDKSFVWSLGEDPKAMMIVEAIISLAHSLGLEVVGEGVESAEQLESLRSMSCDLVQGHHLARPLPSEELETLLAEG